MNQDTEMEQLSPHPRDPNRSSWYTNDTTTDHSFAQSTIHSQDDVAINMKSSPSLVHRQSFHKLDSNDDAPQENYMSTESSSSRAIPNASSKEAPTTTAVAATPPIKPSLWTRFKASLPAFAQFRKTIKASIALLISMVFVFAYETREAVGSSVLLVAIVTIFFFPVRTIVILGVFGGLLATAWSFLGAYLASLARNRSDPNPIQPGACAVLAVFLFLGTFVLNIIRMKVPKGRSGVSFTMTYSAGFAPMVPQIMWLFLRPVAVAGAICLAVNYFIWPDDKHSEAFLSCSQAAEKTSLPSLNARLKNGVLLMIECKRAVKREIIYSRISDVDCSELSKTVTNMRNSLHGVGLALIMKNNYIYSDTKNIYFKRFNEPAILDAFRTSVEGLKPMAAELSSLCYAATNEASTRLGNLHYHPRTTRNSILWPFPRFWVSKPKGPVSATSTAPSTTSTQLHELIERFDQVSKSDVVFRKFLDMNAADIPRNGPLYLIFLYIYNLREHATKVAGLIELIERLETERKKARFWLPHQTLKRWIMSNSNVGGSVGADEGEYQNQGGNDLTRVGTRSDNRTSTEDSNGDIFEPKPSHTDKLGDPDVSAPVTASQKFFYGLYLVVQWLTDTTTFFAFKTAVGVVMLAIPAYRPQDHTWYMDWRGQWAMITLVLWMFPMTGAFIFGLIDRIIGSVVGAVLGIVIWEMCRGNPYGMAVVCFVVFLPLYHIFFFVPKYRVASLMSTVTMLLVVAYEYGYVVDGLTNYDQVYTVAGKRLLLVIIGIAASGILMSIPFPPTGRVELRKEISCTIRDIGKCFGILCASAVSPTGQKAGPHVAKAFGALALELRRQVADERILLHHASYEPPLRGYFPAASYKTLVEKMDNMSDLVTNMGLALREVQPEWRRNIASILMRERKEYLSSILTSLKLVSTTLAAKSALPPYMISPVESRQRFVNLLEKKIMIEPKDIANPSFPSYSAYLMNSLVFVDELQTVLTVTEDLVGVEDPEDWIVSRV
ncbi:hypothetical protein V8B55DRAFT_1464744 [Mucor lusitanicus]